MLTGSEIRRKFLDYFIQHGHREVHSSSLVPANDPTLLFTNAGMNQFKDVFLGLEKRDYQRATTSQKCVRAGGKHNDLENVGFTHRHHTFFEMLGNFSFGDYFKKDAVKFAWDLVTSKEWFGIPKERLFVTIFKGEGGVPRDEEAYRYWHEDQKVPKERIYEFGLKDNFWQMGDTGPCGPCSEIHCDIGPEASDQGHKDCQFGCECGRYVEIWNLVFMQFDRDAGGNLNPLPAPSIDTGAGLERLAAVLQGKVSNYDTDLFVPLMKKAAELCGVDYEKETRAETGARGAASLRVIADHSRAATFLISDGVIPGNEGRSYVLRKIIRRAITHGRLLGQTKPFLYDMVFAVCDLMKDAYPELRESAERVSKAVHAEETRFARTLDLGLKKLEEDLQPLIAAKKQNLASRAMYSGEKAFKLYDTYGMPLDFMVDAARDQGIAFDQDGFDRAMEEQRVRAKASWKGGQKQTANPAYRNLPPTAFEGYRQSASRDCEVLAIIGANHQGVQELKPGHEGEVILDHTPFYAEAGGQVGDVGWLYGADHTTLVAEVRGCYYPIQGVRAHKIVARQPIHVGERVDAVVNTDLRAETMRNHTATHLLHAALREVLGKHVKQAGSLVAPDHLRFDFSHFTAVEDEELQDIENLANREVLRNEKVQMIEDVPIDVAISEYHAMALFGEKYGDRVRVIKIGDFSTELCGGTHTAATGEIGLVKVLDEGSVSSGVRRVNAVTGIGSLHHFRADHQLESVARGLVHFGETPEGSLATALRHEIESRDEEIKRLRKELDKARLKSAASSVSTQEENVRVIQGVKVLATRVDNLERPQMRTLMDQLRDKLGSGVVVMGSASDGRVALLVGVTKDLTSRLQAGKIIRPIAEKVGGSGGGRPDMAEAGGKNPENLDAALSEAYSLVESMLK
ncbi:MAG TPA: alanine--tRNA ligase [Terriglobales bacterium]|nr:alanine--tRNA ligase [Terriglobales bacterium]